MWAFVAMMEREMKKRPNAFGGKMPEVVIRDWDETYEESK